MHPTCVSAKKKTIDDMLCYCCGLALPERRYRLSTPSHNKALVMWKVLVRESGLDSSIVASLDMG